MSNKLNKQIAKIEHTTAGMAVVIVLGMLAIMTIMAFSFATLMRTDRAATGNFVEEIRARQLIDVAIARALATIAEECGAKGLFTTNVTRRVAPSWLVTNSFSADGSLWSSNAASIMSNVFGGYVPDALWNDALSAASKARWIELITTNQGQTYKAGRVAYIILDCSGFIDANIAGGAARSYGVNAAEITLSALTNDFNNASSFISRRNTDVRYETLDELNNTADGIYSPVQNLFVFSYARPDFWDEAGKTNRQQVNLSGDATQIESRRAAILNALVSYCGLTPQQAGIFLTNLLDYVDEDLVPRDFSYSIEAVPLLNEIVIESGDAGAGQMYTKATVEIWNPFDYPRNAFVITTLRTQFGSKKGETNSLNADPKKYNVTPPLQITEPSNATYNVEVYAELAISNITGLVIVDKMQSSITKNITCGQTVSFQVANPLYNYEPAKWIERTPATLGTNNVNLADDPTWISDFSLIPISISTDVGHLNTVGELGNIIYEGWRSIKLYGPNLHPVLSVFGLSENINETYISKPAYRFGLINPNGANEEVWKALLDKMPINQYLSKTVSVASAETLTKIVTPLFNNAGLFTNVADIGRCWPNASAFPSFCNNEFERESVIGNLAGLLNTRQQVFTILVEAQASSAGKFFAQNPLYQRAVVVLWRDAFTGEYFIRYIKYLDE